VTGIDRRRLDELAALLRHRWDPIILDLLIKHPRRYRDLVQQASDKSGEHIAEGVLSLTLLRLTDEGLVTKETSTGGTLYRATPAGSRAMARLQRVIDIATEEGPADSPN
jgi:DNA-binding HxlR family transcriptional regulator